MPDVDWRRVNGIRDVLVHEYHDVEVEIVTDAIARELPRLLCGVESLLADAKA